MPEKTVQKEPGKKPAPSKKPKPQQEVVVQNSALRAASIPGSPFSGAGGCVHAGNHPKRQRVRRPRPRLVRPREDGGYEIVAGHRRKHACELAGLTTMPVI